LTAFVVKSFYQAQKYIDVDLFNVARSVNWILEQQKPSGELNEPGRVIHTDMQVCAKPYPSNRLG
jgi:CD109 antigen